MAIRMICYSKHSTLTFFYGGAVKDKIENQHPQDRLMFNLATKDNWSLKKIGEHIGHVSKQRVSQRIHHLRDSPIDPYRAKRPSPEQIVNACDRAYSLQAAAKSLSVSTETLHRILSQYELLIHYKKTWKEKKKRLHRRRLIKILRLIAKKIGHTPTIREINELATKHKDRIPYHTAWTESFGSFRNAHIVAELTPNNRGRNGTKQKAS